MIFLFFYLLHFIDNKRHVNIIIVFDNKLFFFNTYDFILRLFFI